MNNDKTGQTPGGLSFSEAVQGEDAERAEADARSHVRPSRDEDESCGFDCEIFTDGAYSRKTQRGGLGAVICRDGAIIHYSKPIESETNQRAEMLAALYALEYVKANFHSSVVKLVSDSQYLVNTMLGIWKRKANLDLWIQLDDVDAEFEYVEWEWRPRNSLPHMAQADHLAKEASRGR